MSTETLQPPTAKRQSIRDILKGTKFSIDYYQREYKWERKQVAELIEDLVGKFDDYFASDHGRDRVNEYGHYFLGSIIVSEKLGHRFLIDGQQRLTTLTLILIKLNHLQKGLEDPMPLDEFIRSMHAGKYSFNLDIPERQEVMETLYKGKSPEENGAGESIANIIARYKDIEELLEMLPENSVQHFIDWLIDHVHLVEISAYSDKDAYTIFETMNDRGLSLSPTDMLKGYLLSFITDKDKRVQATDVWKGQVGKLQLIGKEEPADGIKSWLRSQHAESIRERKRGAKPQDFDLIGTEFHRWIREHAETLGLTKADNFFQFIKKDFAFYSEQFLQIRLATEQLTPGLERVFFNAQHNFTLQYPTLLAPLKIGDSPSVIHRKLRIVAAFIDILLTRRIWNAKAIEYSTMQYAMFLVIKEVRGKSPQALVDLLSKRLNKEPETFASNPNFSLHGQNGRQIHRILARMTDFVSVACGNQSAYLSYFAGPYKERHEIEHIWSSHYDEHSDEFDHERDFAIYRNRIGGLLLLPKTFNASFGDLKYEKKLKHYNSQNILARSLHPDCYERHPKFIRFLKETSLPFRAHDHFKKADLDLRQELYLKLAQHMWRPELLEEILDEE